MELSAYYAFPEAHGAICPFTVDYYIDSTLSLENLDKIFHRDILIDSVIFKDILTDVGLIL